MTSRRAFTLIELLVVISIIALLAGLVFVAGNQVRKNQKQAQARIQMQGLSLALSSYLSDYGIIGDQRTANPTDFAASPATFLVVRPLASNRRPYLEPEVRKFTDATGAPITAIANAAKLLDPYRKEMVFTVVNGSSSATQPIDHTVSIEIRCTLGTPSSADDLVLTYQLANDAWEWLK